MTAPPDRVVRSARPPAAAPSLDDLHRATVRGAFWTGIHNATSIPIAFAANAIVARLLGPADYGSLAVIALALTVASIISNFGVSEAVIQWGAAAHGRGDGRSVDGLLQRSLGYHLLVQLPVMALVVLVVGRHESGWMQAALVVAVALPAALGSAALCISIENLTAQAARLTMATNLVLQASIAVAAWINPTAVTVWVTRAAAAGALLPANFLLLSPARRRVAVRPRLPRRMPPGFWRYCAFTTGTTIMTTLVATRSEIVVLDWFGSPEAVGLFAIAFGVAAQLRGPIDALLAPLVPSMAAIVEAHHDLVSSTLGQALRINGLLAGGVMLLVPVAAGLVPWVYGREYAGVALLLLPLAAVAVGQSLVNPLLAITQARRQGRALMVISGLALTADAVVAIAAVQLWGVWGAVAATTAAQLTTTVLLIRLQVDGGLLTYRSALGASFPFLAGVVGVAAWRALVDGVTSVTGYAGPAFPVAVWLAVLGVWWWLVRRTSSSETIDQLLTCCAALPGPARAAGIRLITIFFGRRASPSSSSPGGHA